MVSLLLLAALQLAEARYYRIHDLEPPPEVVLEVGGICLLDDGDPLVCTRRGEVWRVAGAYGEAPSFHLWARGLQEPLGLLNHGGWIYAAQRGELTRMKDGDGDGRAEVFETFCDDWQISGNYHEYAFGPCLDRNGDLWVTLNRAFGEEPFGSALWRGWAVRITPEGAMHPVATGLRSPAGVEVAPWGDVFYTDNQGEWCGASKLSHLEPGDFHGHPFGLSSCSHPRSEVPDPGHPPDGMSMPEVAKLMPSFKLPAVWFPYDKMGKSPSGMVWDQSGGAFGPFHGQLLVGDQHHSWIMRVFLEKVNGHWQGACFPFRQGFRSGVLRLAWGSDRSLFAGMTNRGWGSRGDSDRGLQRLSWTGETPFEILSIEVQAGGFRFTFTKPVGALSALQPGSFRVSSYTYKLHSDYGSPEVDTKELEVPELACTADGRAVLLSVPGLREGYVHEFHLRGVRSAAGEPLLHPDAYYTLIRRP